jgi:hypothetical protein
MPKSKRTKHWTIGIGTLLALVGSQASGCGPSFSSCEATRTCETSSGGRAETGGAAGDTQEAGADSASGTAGAMSGGTGSGGDMGDSGAGAGGRAAGGSIPTGGVPNDAGARAGEQAGGQNVAAGRAGGGDTVSPSGGEGGAPISTGSAGESGAGLSSQTECKAGYTVLCGDLYGSSSCAKKRLSCLEDGSWPPEETGCAPSNRDCASPDDNDCDGRADNTIDETCPCTDLGVPVGNTLCLRYSPDTDLAGTCCQCSGNRGVFQFAKKSSTTYACMVP